MPAGGVTDSLADLLSELARRRVRLRLEGGQVRCIAPSGVLTGDLLVRIKAAKPELVDHLKERDLLPVTDRTGPVPLSFAQEQLWLAGHLDPDSSAYHIPLAARLAGPLRPAALAHALAQLVRRHEALRTSFPVRNGRPCQRVADFAPPPLPLVDLSALPPRLRDRTVEALTAAEARRPFDLAAGPVLRAALVRTAAADHRLLLTRHHIASDGWSFGILAAELSAHYRAGHAGAPPPAASLPPLPRQYADFAAWQRGADQDAGRRQRLQTWVRRLTGAPLGLDLVDAPGAGPATEPAAAVRRELPAELSAAVRLAAADAGTTVFTVLAAAFGLALGSAAGQREVVVGCPASGRSRTELENLIGCFATVLPLRLDLSGAASFGQAVCLVQETLNEALGNQDVPLEQIAAGLRAQRRHYGRTPLFSAALAFQNTPDGLVDLPGVEVELAEPAAVSPKFPLTVTVTEDGGGYRVLAEHAPAAIGAAAVQDVLGRFHAILAGGCADPAVTPAELVRAAAPVPAAVEVAPDGVGILGGVGAAGGAAARALGGAASLAAAASGSLGAAFVAAAARTPDAIAVSQGEHQLSYAALHRRAGRLAAALRHAGVAPEAPVGVCAGHTPDLVVAVLAVTLAGGCYLPVDPEDPPARHEAVLADAGAIALVTTAAQVEAFAWFDGPVLSADRDRGWPAADAPVPAPAGVEPDNLAYVVYTSGSTGTPKGVMVSHRNLLTLLAVAGDLFDFTGRDTWSLTHSSAFDFSVWEMWGPLLSGGRLAVVPRAAARDPDELWRLLRAEQVTVLSATPSAFLALVPVATGGAGALRTVVFGGERCEPRKLLGWFEACGDERPALVNMYGITETTVHVTWRRLATADAADAVSPIGRALPGVVLHVVDRHGAPTAIGGQGELLVGGTGVARGYLGLPGLTADRFRPDHLGSAPGARLYRSGDLGRRLPGGEAGYLGRTDQQVKVRGYRIEPGEIEAVLARHPDVAAAAVGVAGDGDRTVLVGYLVPAAARGGSPELSPRELRRYLSGWLPPYLVPSAYVLLDRLPLTRNGKLDRAALASIPAIGPAVGREPAAEADPPGTPTEVALAGLWCELLGLASVGVHENFFDVGGDSLLVTRLHARLPALFGVELPMRRIYQALTVVAQAEAVDALLTQQQPPAHAAVGSPEPVR